MGAGKNTGHVSGTSQLGLQTGGAGHNLGTPGGDARISLEIGGSTKTRRSSEDVSH